MSIQKLDFNIPPGHSQTHNPENAVVIKGAGNDEGAESASKHQPWQAPHLDSASSNAYGVASHAGIVLDRAAEASIMASHSRKQDEINAIEDSQQQAQIEQALSERMEALKVEAMANAQQEIMVKQGRQLEAFNELLEVLSNKNDQDSATVDGRSTNIAFLYDCVHLSVQLCKQLLARELSIKPCDLVNLLEPYLSESDTANKPLHVHLHLSDLQALQLHSAWSQLQQKCQFSTHPELQEGDLMVETQTQFIDARLDLRLQKLVDELYQSVSIESPSGSREVSHD